PASLDPRVPANVRVVATRFALDISKMPRSPAASPPQRTLTRTNGNVGTLDAHRDAAPLTLSAGRRRRRHIAQQVLKAQLPSDAAECVREAGGILDVKRPPSCESGELIEERRRRGSEGYRIHDDVGPAGLLERIFGGGP